LQEVQKQSESDRQSLQSQLDNLRNYSKNRDSEYVDLNAMFERERIIYNAKIQHLEDFKEKLTQDLNDSNVKFEQAMTHLNNRNQNEREKWEKSHESLVKSIESRHKDQMDQYKSEISHLAAELTERDR